MASIEALSYLERDEAAWSTYIRNHPGQIDLGNANLANHDLRGRQFRDCSLVGANLEHANLDGASFLRCDLTSTVLVDASLVGCHFTDVVMKGTDLSRAVLRRSTLVRVDIKEVTWAELFVGDCIVDKCSLSDARLHRTRFAEIVSSRTKILDAIGEDVVISRCKFVECEFATIQFGPSDVQASEIKNSVMRCCTFFGGPFNDNALVQSTLSRLELRSSDAKNLDFTGSMLIEVDLTWLNLPSAVLLDSAVINCLWPEQNGRITTTGCYKPSPHLVAQPVQDVKGVSPLLRREIADAQFLVTKLARASHAGARFALRAWGATSAYGQSLIRLTVWSCIAVAFNAVLLLSGRGQIFRFGSDHHLDFTLVAKPLDIVVRSFLGLGGEPMHLTIVDQTVLVVARVEGFVALGLWISIAAMKVSRLSSE